MASDVDEDSRVELPLGKLIRGAHIASYKRCSSYIFSVYLHVAVDATGCFSLRCFADDTAASPC